ncbi:hypothetical protein COLU111180_18540 [Cohnella lubricantis]|uniref:Uncharacterized protein n=1 Tax=Cohnella lubricantis TaxID=2163172 RepID=A0A841T792_9BACL|nr:hypothetical protein [Cohnella lubricantis]MBB6675805.1 hypothetical protein [Cohnella lubricantis]MBP2119885.1 hypothetical protein [Cohnella lubricantis]
MNDYEERKGELSMATAKKLDQIELNPKNKDQFDRVVKFLEATELPNIVKSVDHTYKPTPRAKKK